MWSGQIVTVALTVGSNVAVIEPSSNFGIERYYFIYLHVGRCFLLPAL